MGAGIAQLALEAGHEVVLHDVDEAAIERGRAAIRDGLARRAARLDLDADSIDDWVDGRLAGLRDAAHPRRGRRRGGARDRGRPRGPRAQADDLRARSTRRPRADVILATNTSALSVGAIAAATTPPRAGARAALLQPGAGDAARRGRGRASATDPAIVERAIAPDAAWGKTPVRCADSPGFIVNRVNRPFTLEALRMLEAGLGRRSRRSTPRSGRPGSRWARSS